MPEEKEKTAIELLKEWKNMIQGMKEYKIFGLPNLGYWIPEILKCLIKLEKQNARRRKKRNKRPNWRMC
jgi:hypothetical protein